MAAKREGQILIQDPLDGESVLLDAMFGEGNETRRPARPTIASLKPEHYKVVSISLYKEDIQRLDAMVRELKRRGHHKANKSQLIRYALTMLDLDTVPKEI